MDDSSQPLISLVIPTVGSKTLPECLASAKNALAGFSHEILVTKDHGLGVAETRNRGLMTARGQYFILIDDDCILDSPELVNNLLHRAKDENFLHGGVYRIKKPASYWAQVYSLINTLWLENGIDPKGHQKHLLGGFLFGSHIIKKQIHFSNSLKWGGEEKELLMRLRKLGVFGKIHPELSILHLDQSGFFKFVKRAFFQGLAAGEHDLVESASYKNSLALQWNLLPGLALFYSFSRFGIFLGKIKNLFGIKIKKAEISPNP